jgi:hypothetical protein
VGIIINNRSGMMKIWYGKSTVGLELYVVSKEAIYLSSESKEGDGENI